MIFLEFGADSESEFTPETTAEWIRPLDRWMSTLRRKTIHLIQKNEKLTSPPTLTPPILCSIVIQAVKIMLQDVEL